MATRAEKVAEKLSHQNYLKRIAKEKKRDEKLSRDVSEKARHRFCFCATNRDHEMIVCIWCDPEHDNPWCADCWPRRCQSCDTCKGCKETMNNCGCGNFPLE